MGIIQGGSRMPRFSTLELAEGLPLFGEGILLGSSSAFRISGLQVSLSSFGLKVGVGPKCNEFSGL